MIEAMRADGLDPDSEIIADGIFRRINDRSKPGKNQLIGYVCFGSAGYYCHWSKLPDGRNWSSKAEREFTPEERRAYAVQMQAARQARQQAEEQRHAECRDRSLAIWESATEPPPDFAYLLKKQISACGSRLHLGRLVVPVWDADNTLHGLQFITADGGKRFEPGTAVAGHFSYILGDRNKPFFVTEGYATAASIHQVTGATVFIAFSCGNLKAVCQAVRAKMPEKQIVVCADTDRFTDGNPGLTHATAAASAIGALLAIPAFKSDTGTDWNDLFCQEGAQAVQQQLQAVFDEKPSMTIARPTKYSLRPYQQRALDRIRQAIADGKRRIMVCSPTGSGKGVLLSHIIGLAHAKGQTVLFLVHRQEILFQVSDYLNHHGIEHGIIKAGVQHEDHHPVQLASFQTLSRRKKSPFIKAAEIVIIDEAHHATAKTYLEVIELFSKKIILGFSATPARQNGLGLGNLFETMIQVATIRELTEQGFLAPVRYFAPVRPDLSGVKMQAGDYNQKQLEPVMLEKGLVGKLVEHWQQFGENRQTMCFATGVKHSLAICQQFRRHGITAEHVDGTTKNEERESIVSRFKAGLIKVLVNCQVFTEGVDVPEIGCVILARPTKSLPMFLQMVGRGMRTIAGKTDCILLDHAGACLQHGFAEEITTWELETSSKTTNKKQERRKKKESEPITCPVCSFIYTGRLQCPHCGNIPELKQFPKDVDYIDGQLGEVVYKSKKPKQPEPDRRQWFRELKRHAVNRGYSTGWASHAYREKFGTWPGNLSGLPPAESISSEVMGFIKHRQIRRAYGSNADRQASP
ncbi:MAG: toprim domain-containing protein [Geobacter sp.]|nr:toprim domain-containing protein [Geobacter sp.]